MTPDSKNETPQRVGCGALFGVVLRAQYDAYEGWRVIYRHRNEVTALPEGGCKISLIPDDSGPFFTTVARCCDGEWARRIVAALSSPNHRLRDTQK